MKEYYQQRLHWIFTYRNRKFGYCLAKTLCLVVGVPIYAVMFALEMVFTAINMIFSWIPVLNVVIFTICKVLIAFFGCFFYICILPDLKQYKQAMKDSVDYDVADQSDEEQSPSETAQTQQDPTDDNNA